MVTFYSIKILLTLFVIILIPVYWSNYGFQNFLWFSDIGLFLTVLALWLESPLLISVAVIAILPVEIVWNIDFFAQLATGHTILGLASYMFDQKYSLFLRSLSLFHIFIPILWFWYIFKWGYDKRAFKYAILLIWVVLITTYMYTTPHENINWLFLPEIRHWLYISRLEWLAILMVGLPLLLLWPMHILFLVAFLNPLNIHTKHGKNI